MEHISIRPAIKELDHSIDNPIANSPLVGREKIKYLLDFAIFSSNIVIYNSF